MPRDEIVFYAAVGCTPHSVFTRVSIERYGYAGCEVWQPTNRDIGRSRYTCTYEKARMPNLLPVVYSSPL